MSAGVLAVVERDAHLRQSRAAAARHEASSPWSPWRSQGLSRTQVGAGFAGAAAVTALAVGLRRYVFRDRPIGPEDLSRRVAVEAPGLVAASVYVRSTSDIQSKGHKVPASRVVVMPVTPTTSESKNLPEVHNAGEIIRLVASRQHGESNLTRLAERYAWVLKEFADRCGAREQLHLYLPLLSKGSNTNPRVPYLDSRAFYDAYDVLVYGGVVNPADLALRNITILPRDDSEVEVCRQEFRESEYGVTYVGGFTIHDPPPSRGTQVQPVPVVGVVREADIRKFAGAGFMMHASATSDEYASLTSETRDKNQAISDFKTSMACFGLSYMKYYDHNRTDLLALPALLCATGATGVTPREVVVRVVRDAHDVGFFSAGEKPLIAKLFFLYVREDAPDHVASVCAGFDAMIREGVSRAITSPKIFFRNGERITEEKVKLAQGIVKSALEQTVPSSLGTTYSSYITAAFVLDSEAAAERVSNFGGVELYTVP